MTTTPRTALDDHEVKDAILAELDWLPSVQADRIGVAINDGAVTLSGQVQTLPEKRAAVRSAFHVRGVTAVADEIEVHNTGAQRTDTDIAREADAFLNRTGTTPLGSVQAEVHNQVVTLTGTVEWQYQREVIKTAIEIIPGVQGVANLIALKPTIHVSAAVAKSKIGDALRRHATLEAEHIEVAVSGDKIKLSGHVASWAERDEAGRAAWATPGVTHVDNNLYLRL